MPPCTDAGTPGISDPAGTCVEAGIEVETLPGATARADSGAGAERVSCDRFCFEGFPLQKKGRMKQLQALAGEERTMIFYESPFYRVVRCLEQFAEVFGEDRRVSGVAHAQLAVVDHRLALSVVEQCVRPLAFGSARPRSWPAAPRRSPRSPTRSRPAWPRS